MKKLTTTQKIFTLFIAITIISFLVWGCGTTTTTEMRNDSTAVIVDTTKQLDTNDYKKLNKERLKELSNTATLDTLK
jgi:hypothetical protein